MDETVQGEGTDWKENMGKYQILGHANTSS